MLAGVAACRLLEEAGRNRGQVTGDRCENSLALVCLDQVIKGMKRGKDEGGERSEFSPADTAVVADTAAPKGAGREDRKRAGKIAKVGQTWNLTIP
jgi:hypothetical protein